MKGGDILEFCKVLGCLKHLPRTGWLDNDINQPETVSGHMYRMAVLSLLLADDQESKLDTSKCVEMCLIHDMAESIVGDLTPSCGVNREDKLKMEEQALGKIASLLSDEVGQKIVDLWKEFEEGRSAEAKAVRDLDKFDMIMQAFEYEQQLNRPNFLQDFFSSTRGIFQTPTVVSWVEELEKRRSALQKESGKIVEMNE